MQDSKTDIIICLRKIITPVMMAVVFLSCSSTGKLPIQISLPPKHPVSPQIQSLALLNRSINLKFTNLRRDSLESLLIKENMMLDTVILDSIAADTAIQVAAQALYESDRFDVVVPLQRNIKRTDKRNGLQEPLDKSYITRICSNYKVDAVLVLESFNEKITTDVNSERMFLGFESGRPVHSYRAVYNVFYDQVWRLYQPGLDPPILRLNVKDTVFWESFDYSLKEMYRRLPSVKEALIGGGIAAGADIAGTISPKWFDDTRSYYKTGNREIDAAIPLMKAYKWDEAGEILEKYANISSNNIRSKVEFNLALASEMKGNLDKAIDWGIKSYKTKYSLKTERYLKYLNQRKVQIQKLSGTRTIN